MENYNDIRNHCTKGTRTSEIVLDDFLIYYAAVRNKLGDEFENKISRYKAVIKEMPAEWKGLVKSQYICHRIFKDKGLIHSYLNHSAIKELDFEHQEFLRKISVLPWRFSFSEIIAKPENDFYEMEDVFTGETFLLYSESVEQTLSERPVMLWFNLIGFNGKCWQTFGPVTAFQAMDADDVYFFATEVNSAIDSEEDLMQDVENNPLPYMALAAGSVYPQIRTKGFEIVQLVGETESEHFDLKSLKKVFTVEYAGGIFRISHKTWSQWPHFAEAWYVEENRNLILSSLTDTSYRKMAIECNKKGYTLPLAPDIRVHLHVLNLIKLILKRDLDLIPYSHLFEKTKSPEEDIQLERMNQFILLALPYINEGKEPDVETLAKKADLDPGIARELLQKIMKR